MTNFVKVLDRVGSFGRYQKLRVLLLLLISGVYIGLTIGVLMFIIMPSAHWCQIPPRDTLSPALQNLTADELDKLLIPEKKNRRGLIHKAKCEMKDPFECKTLFGWFRKCAKIKKDLTASEWNQKGNIAFFTLEKPEVVP